VPARTSILVAKKTGKRGGGVGGGGGWGGGGVVLGWGGEGGCWVVLGGRRLGCGVMPPLPKVSPDHKKLSEKKGHHQRREGRDPLPPEGEITFGRRVILWPPNCWRRKVRGGKAPLCREDFFVDFTRRRVCSFQGGAQERKSLREGILFGPSCSKVSTGNCYAGSELEDLKGSWEGRDWSGGAVPSRDSTFSGRLGTWGVQLGQEEKEANIFKRGIRGQKGHASGKISSRTPLSGRTTVEKRSRYEKKKRKLMPT